LMDHVYSAMELQDYTLVLQASIFMGRIKWFLHEGVSHFRATAFY
jgi:hypothetical protein